MASERDRKPVAPASTVTVRRALAAYTSGVLTGDARSASVTFLDRIGFRSLDDRSAVLAFSDAAAHTLRETLPLSPPLAHVVIERLGDIQPGVPGDDMPRLVLGYWWFAQCAGHAADTLPVEDPDSGAYLDFLAAIPLNNARYGSAFRRAIVRHPACPADVLYTAALDWPWEEARLVATHANATDEARVAVALRG